jgi:hypothetical protein
MPEGLCAEVHNGAGLLASDDSMAASGPYAGVAAPVRRGRRESTSTSPEGLHVEDIRAQRRYFGMSEREVFR